MARGQNSPTVEAPEAPEVSTDQATPAEATVTSVEGNGTSAPAEASTETPAAQAPASTTTEIDLGPLNEAIKTAVESADETTGVVADAFVASVVKEYRALPAKGKNQAKKAVNDSLREAVTGRELPKAQAYVQLSDAMTDGTASKGTRETREPVDPTEAFVARAVTLRLAQNIFTSQVPDGVKDNWKDLAGKEVSDLAPQVAAYGDYLKAKAAHTGEGDGPAEPEGVSVVVKTAFKLAQGRAAGLPKAPRAAATSNSTYTGPTRSIVAHIQQAFEDQPSGAFLKVNEIRKFVSREYGTDLPSSGAVRARLKSKTPIEGITPGEKDGHQGAYKD